jgi:hypothetical protein
MLGSSLVQPTGPSGYRGRTRITGSACPLRCPNGHATAAWCGSLRLSSWNPQAFRGLHERCQRGCRRFEPGLVLQIFRNALADLLRGRSGFGRMWRHVISPVHLRLIPEWGRGASRSRTVGTQWARSSAASHGGGCVSIKWAKSSENRVFETRGMISVRCRCSERSAECPETQLGRSSAVPRRTDIEDRQCQVFAPQAARRS